LGAPAAAGAPFFLPLHDSDPRSRPDRDSEHAAASSPPVNADEEFAESARWLARMRAGELE
jgi:hypothetical protein